MEAGGSGQGQGRACEIPSSERVALAENSIEFPECLVACQGIPGRAADQEERETRDLLFVVSVLAKW